MSNSIQKTMTPEEVELEKKQIELGLLETEYAEKQLELSTIEANILCFKNAYFKRVGYLYPILDDIEAQIAEAVARNMPNDQRAKAKSAEYRKKADESSAEAALAEKQKGADKFKPSEDLKSLYRTAAKAIHPDLAETEDERKFKEKMMAAVNEAYQKGDFDRLRMILQEWESSPDSIKGEGIALDLIRVIRHIAIVRRRIEQLNQDMENLKKSSMAVLLNEVNTALEKGEDVLEQLASNLKSEIEDAKKRLDSLLFSGNR